MIKWFCHHQLNWTWHASSRSQPSSEEYCLHHCYFSSGSRLGRGGPRVITARNSSCRKVMFSQVSVCLQEGAYMAGGMHGKEHAWQGVRAGEKATEAAVRILLECILVLHTNDTTNDNLALTTIWPTIYDWQNAYPFHLFQIHYSSSTRHPQSLCSTSRNW